MAITGLTGAPVHAGSWFGLPDFGISEFLSGGNNLTPQGGSNLNSTPQLGSSPISPTSPQGQTVNSLGNYNPTGNATTTTTAGPTQPTNNPPAQGPNPFDAAGAAANSQNNALLSSLNTQFDRNAANAQNQLGALSNQYNDSLSQLDSTWGQAQSQTANAKQSEQTNADNQINQAGSVAHQTQQQTRNILRALGIEGGTYAGEQLGKPLNAYDQQRGQIMTVLSQRNNQLDDFLNQQATQHAQAVTSVQNNYNQLVNQIQTDLRFNDRQRADAIQSANAALQDHLAQIQQSMFNYKTQVDSAKAGLGQLATTLSGYNGSNGQNSNAANLPAIQATAPDYAQPQSQTASIVQPLDKKNLLLSGGLTDGNVNQTGLSQ